MPVRTEWVLLAYRIPREPSTPRISVWRKLRRLGAMQLVDGLVALPNDARNREQLEWLADEVLDAGGETTLWIAHAGSAKQERELIGRLSGAIAEEYRAVIDEARALAGTGGVTERTIARLRRDLARIGQRDFFPLVERRAAHDAVEALATSVEGVR